MCGCKKAKRIRAKAEAARRLMTLAEAERALAADLGVSVAYLRRWMGDRPPHMNIRPSRSVRSSAAPMGLPPSEVAASG